jgi:hypothetical protein
MKALYTSRNLLVLLGSIGITISGLCISVNSVNADVIKNGIKRGPGIILPVTITATGYVVPDFGAVDLSDKVFEIPCRDVQVTLEKNSKTLASTQATPRNSSAGTINSYECQYSLTFQGDKSDYITSNISGSPNYVITAASSNGGRTGILGSQAIFSPLPTPLSVTVKVRNYFFGPR